jgi:cation transport ATPase
MEGFSEADVPEGFAFFTGMGLRGTVEGREILIGNPRLMEKIPVA